MAAKTNGVKRNDIYEDSLRPILSDFKRSMLDFLDEFESQAKDENERKKWGKIKKRIHNDVGNMEFKFRLITQIFNDGGIIPPFGPKEK